METKTNPLLSHRTKSKYLLGSSFKGLLLILIASGLLLLTSCLNKTLKLPTFMSEDYKQTDIIQNDKIIAIINLYSSGKINTLSFQMGVHDYEESFYYQMNHIKQITPEFFLELEPKFKEIYSLTKSFKSNSKDSVNYLKNTILRLCNFMLQSMSLEETSIILSVYYSNLDVKEKDYIFDYTLSIAEVIFSSLERVTESKVSIADMKTIKANISKTGTPFKRKEIKLGLRYSFQRLEKLTFLIDSRITDLEILRTEIKRGRTLFIEKDSSFELMNSLVDLKLVNWVNEVDYPYLMGNGFVKVFPTETFSVRQYGKFKGKDYAFSESLVKYRNNKSFWIRGSYELKNSSMKILIGRYETEVEVFRVTKDTYLLGSEVLLKE